MFTSFLYFPFIAWLFITVCCKILRFFKWSFYGSRILFDCWTSGSIRWKGSRFSKPSIPSDTAFVISGECHPLAMISLTAADVRWLYAYISQLACNGFGTDTLSLILISSIGTFSSSCFPTSLKEPLTVKFVMLAGICWFFCASFY